MVLGFDLTLALHLSLATKPTCPFSEQGSEYATAATNPVENLGPYPLSCYRQGCFSCRLWHSRPPCAALRAIHQENPALSKLCTLMVCCAVILLRPCSGPSLNALQDVFLRQSSSAYNMAV